MLIPSLRRRPTKDSPAQRLNPIRRSGGTFQPCATAGGEVAAGCGITASAADGASATSRSGGICTSSGSADVCRKIGARSCISLVEGTSVPEGVLVTVFTTMHIHAARRRLHLRSAVATLGHLHHRGHSSVTRPTTGARIPFGACCAVPRPCTSPPGAGSLVKCGGDDDIGTWGLSAPCEFAPPRVLTRLDAAEGEGPRRSGIAAWLSQPPCPAAAPGSASAAKHEWKGAADLGEHMTFGGPPFRLHVPYVPHASSSLLLAGKLLIDRPSVADGTPPSALLMPPVVLLLQPGLLLRSGGGSPAEAFCFTGGEHGQGNPQRPGDQWSPPHIIL